MLQHELEKLLKVTPADVDAVMKDFIVSRVASSPDQRVTFHYIRFQGSSVRLKDLIMQLLNLIVFYCLPRKRQEQLAKRPFELVKEARNSFRQPSNPAKSGEFGELMTYFLLEGRLRAPQIISKMALKTAGNMNIHGSDGIHLGFRDGALTFYYAESKLYHRVREAIKSALGSVSDFYSKEVYGSDTQYNFEVNLVRNHLDIPQGPLREHVVQMLDPYSPTRDEYSHTNAVFIGFNWLPLKKGLHEQDPAWSRQFENMATEISGMLEDVFTTHPKLATQKWHFFFVPFADVDSVREKFSRELKN